MNSSILRTYLRILAVVFLLSCLPAFAQTPQKIEKELVNHAMRIRALVSDEVEDRAVKLDAENDALKAKLVKYGRLASTLKYPFNELKKHLFVASSKDGKFRIYSWDTETGGTMHFYENVFQYQGGDGKIYAKAAVLDEDDSGGFYSDIFQVSTKTGMVYLGRMTATLSTKHSYEEVALFKIAGRTLDDRVRLFKTKAGLQDHIGFEYNFFSAVNRKERPIKLIQFDDRSGTVRIPIVLIKKDDEIGTVTNRFINYRFNGSYFVNVK
jgi:hypothetical protein